MICASGPIDLKARITERIKDEQAAADALRAEIEADPKMDIHAREERYQEIDKLEEEMVKEIEEVLLEILPEAFAVVKETARRFKENGEVRVRATDYRPRTGRQTGEHRHRRRRGGLEEHVDRRRQSHDLGHGALRRAADRRYRPAQRQDRRDGHR